MKVTTHHHQHPHQHPHPHPHPLHQHQYQHYHQRKRVNTWLLTVSSSTHTTPSPPPKLLPDPPLSSKAMSVMLTCSKDHLLRRGPYCYRDTNEETASAMRSRRVSSRSWASSADGNIMPQPMEAHTGCRFLILLLWDLVPTTRHTEYLVFVNRWKSDVYLVGKYARCNILWSIR